MQDQYLPKAFFPCLIQDSRMWTPHCGARNSWVKLLIRKRTFLRELRNSSKFGRSKEPNEIRTSYKANHMALWSDPENPGKPILQRTSNHLISILFRSDLWPGYHGAQFETFKLKLSINAVGKLSYLSLWSAEVRRKGTNYQQFVRQFHYL